MSSTAVSPLKSSGNRLYSIDVFRALTMLLMIFVNDLWTLKDIPGWLEHKPADFDGMGLADTVFPAFLFIVGLSIPFSIMARRKRESSNFSILQHILLRSLALIIMGFFMVNLETINTKLIPIHKGIWQILMTLAFFLIWINYEEFKGIKKAYVWILRSLGILLLIYLAWIYIGGTPEAPVWMKTQWWGILGLIGWAYLLCSLIYLLAGNRLIYIILAFLILHLLNVQEFISPWEPGKIRLVVGAANHANVMGGVLASVILIRIREMNKMHVFIFPLLGLSALMVLYGFAIRTEAGISKIYGTPSWTAICTGINFAVFTVLFLIADIWQKYKWYSLIKPAGTSTLTCYLIPYYAYAMVLLINMQLPLSLRTGMVGIVKSIVFSFFIILVTRLLEKISIRLKI